MTNLTDTKKLRIYRFLKKAGEIVDTPILRDGTTPIVFRPSRPISPLELAQIVLDKCGAEINALRTKRPGQMVII